MSSILWSQQVTKYH